MQQSETIVDGRDDRIEAGDHRRQWRLVPPAITPVSMADVGAGILGQLRGTGRDRFRQRIVEYLDASDAATYTSFRRALAGCFHELSARAPDNRRRILIPAFCSSDFPDSIDGVGLEPVRYDVDPDSLALDLADLTDKLDEDTLAVVAVNVLGYSSPMTDLATLCEDHSVALVEALGYALGTEYEGQLLGMFGDCAVLNFQQGKPIPVGGGMVVSQNASLSFGDHDRPAVRPNLGALAGYAALSRPRAYYGYSTLKDYLDEITSLSDRVTTHPEPKFDVEYAPPFATMSDFQGAIGTRIIDRLDAHRRDRKETARFYAETLASEPRVTTLEPVGGLSNLQYVRFPVLFDSESLRDHVKTTLNRAGIQATTLYDWPVIDPDSFPGAGSLQRRILTLPTHPYVDASDRRVVVETIIDSI